MLPIRFQAYKYDPYEKKFTIEQYDHAAMQNIRLDAVQRSKNVGQERQTTAYCCKIGI